MKKKKKQKQILIALFLQLTHQKFYTSLLHVQSSVALNQVFSLKEKYPLKIHKLYHKLKFIFIVA